MNSMSTAIEVSHSCLSIVGQAAAIWPLATPLGLAPEVRSNSDIDSSGPDDAAKRPLHRDAGSGADPKS